MSAVNEILDTFKNKKYEEPEDAVAILLLRHLLENPLFPMRGRNYICGGLLMVIHMIKSYNVQSQYTWADEPLFLSDGLNKPFPFKYIWSYSSDLAMKLTKASNIEMQQKLANYLSKKRMLKLEREKKKKRDGFYSSVGPVLNEFKSLDTFLNMTQASLIDESIIYENNGKHYVFCITEARKRLASSDNLRVKRTKLA